MSNVRSLSFAAIAAVLLLSACGSTQHEGDRIGGGAGVGAATGAAVGAIFGGVGALPGALIGAAVGAGTGAVTNEHQIDLGKPVWDRS